MIRVMWKARKGVKDCTVDSQNSYALEGYGVSFKEIEEFEIEAAKKGGSFDLWIRRFNFVTAYDRRLSSSESARKTFLLLSIRSKRSEFYLKHSEKCSFNELVDLLRRDAKESESKNCRDILMDLHTLVQNK